MCWQPQYSSPNTAVLVVMENEFSRSFLSTPSTSSIPSILSLPHSQASVSALESPVFDGEEYEERNKYNYENNYNYTKLFTRRILAMESSAASRVSSKRVLSPEAQAVVKREKDFIKFRVPSLELFPLLNSSLWGQVYHVDWTEFEALKQQIPSLQLERNKGLAKLMLAFQEGATPKDAEEDYKAMARRLVVCPICFNDPNVSLFSSIVFCGKGFTSNIGQHRFAKHSDLDFPKTTKQAFGVPITSSSKSVTSSSQSSISRYVHNQPLNKEQAIIAVKNAIYQCVNDCGFPSHTVEKPIFRELLNTVRENASFLKPTDLQISTRALETMRINSYSAFITLVKDLGVSVREYYVRRCGKAIPFATICHDIWQGKKKDILGVSLMFADPRNCVMYQIPIGLVQTKGHNAQQVAEVTHNLMLSFGFSQADLSASVNDNTNSAVLAGKYILGTTNAGKCDMHKAELVVKHATGIAERTEAKKVVDTNLPFRALYKKFHKFASWLMSKRSPARWNNFKNFCLQNNSVVIEIALPGDTRVAGVEIMFQSLIRIKWQMDDYASRAFAPGETHAEFKSQYPKQEDWILLSEYEGILAPLQKFAMTLQSDEPGANSASLMEAYTMRHQVAKMRTGTVSIISLVASDYDIQSTWDGSVPLSTLDKKRIEKKFEDLHDAAQLLINRLFKEYQSYFMDTVDKSGEFGICSNPLLVDIVPKFFFFLSAFKATDTERMYKSFIMDMVEKHWVPPSTKTQTEAAPKDADAVVPSATPKPTPNPDPIKRKMNDIFAAFLASEIVGERSATAPTPDPDALSDDEQKKLLYKECEEAFHYYVNDCKTQISDWFAMIEAYPSKKYLTESKNWSQEQRETFQEYCNMKNYCMIGKYFDVMSWWRINGERFAKVFPSAIVALSQPATNAFQERVFSLASWFDSNRLMNRTFPKNFEMRTMEAITRKMRKELVLNESLLEEQEKLNEKRKQAPTHSKVSSKSKHDDGAAVTRQLMNMTTYIHRFNTTGTLPENRETDPGKSLRMKFVARYKDLAASAAELARVSCVPSPGEPTPCGDVTDFAIVDTAEETAEEEQEVPVNDQGLSQADGVQVLAIQYDSDIDDTDTDDENECDTDKMLLENLQSILTERNTLVVEDSSDESIVKASSPSRKVSASESAPRNTAETQSLVSADPVDVNATSGDTGEEEGGFLGWMMSNHHTLFGIPRKDTPVPSNPPVTHTKRRKGTPTKRDKATTDDDDEDLEDLDETYQPSKKQAMGKPSKKQGLIPTRKSPSRAAKSKNDIAREKLSGEAQKKKTEEEKEAERIKRKQNLHQSQTALMKKRVEERERKAMEELDLAVKLSLDTTDTELEAQIDTELEATELEAP